MQSTLYLIHGVGVALDLKLLGTGKSCDAARFVASDELQHLSELAQERGIPLIVDNAYGQPFPNVVFRDVRPVWGVWLDGAVWFSSGSRIATHLERDPRASITLDDGDRAVHILVRPSGKK